MAFVNKQAIIRSIWADTVPGHALSLSDHLACDLVQLYRELAEVMIVERALRVGRLLERESLRHFDVEGAGLDQAVNFLERRILIFPVIRLHGDAGTIFLWQLNTVRMGDSSTATH